ncbi:hypothetical protein MUN84_22135 [Hymenobacter sp. 5516J-16]|uniref:hypothetical protein n=1 Tax=Hymenobacter sp. 5516J-16 TaxID=2932253 RepID=UPI001FD1F758|nr:hypothetical protein [Hymenobacter sp. 5516J-16]UOQ79208.1 hypothetical protein MUN84_22135 [Hymenobacter sp. 5516J-16]
MRPVLDQLRAPSPPGKNLTLGLKYSCNPYFYQVMERLINRVPDTLAVVDTVAARHANLELWRRHARSFGLDSVLGVDLPREAPVSCLPRVLRQGAPHHPLDLPIHLLA